MLVAVVFVAASLASTGATPRAVAASGNVLTQLPGTAGCISETGSGGACINGTALFDARSVTVSPDGRSVYVASATSDSVAIFDRASTGVLTQKAGTAGCISEDGSGGACVDGTGLNGAFSVTVSPDGTSVYVASFFIHAVAIFDRAGTGALTQKGGTAGCISETGSGGACIDGTALFDARSVTVSPDGRSVYVASLISDAVAIFDRAGTGALTQKGGTAGCISETGSLGACVNGTALDGARSVTVSPDGASVYVASADSDAVAIFNRAGTGALTQKAGTPGCISRTGSGEACIIGTALDGALSVTVSPNGTSVYVASEISDAVAIFDRDGTGMLTQKGGTAGCISEDGSLGACINGTALDSVRSVTVSPDGTSVYVASASSHAVAIFDRAVTGVLTQKGGTAGCISEDGSLGACVNGTALSGAASVTHSPDGASVYVASLESSAVAIFDFCPIVCIRRVQAPESTIVSDPIIKTRDRTPTFSFTSEVAGTRFECSVDGGAFTSCISPATTPKLSLGPHAFAVRAIDTDGNVDPTPATDDFTVKKKHKKRR